MEINENNLCAVSQDVDKFEWPVIGQKLHIEQINDKCLQQTLKQWHSNIKGDPWTIWRKLAMIITRLYDSKTGQKLRQLAGVGA